MQHMQHTVRHLNFRVSVIFPFLILLLTTITFAIHVTAAAGSPTLPTDYDSSVLPADMPTVFKLAWLGPMALPNSNSLTFGHPGLQGFLIAVDEANASPFMTSTQIEVILAETKSDSATTITATYDVINQGAIGLVGEYLSGLTQLVQYVAMKNQVPHISPSATAVDFTTNHASLYPYFMRNVPNVNVFAPFLANLTKANGWNRVGLVYTVDSFGSSGAIAYTNMATSIGLSVDLTVSFGQGMQTDFPFLVQRMIESNLRIFVYWGLAADLQALWRYIKANSPIDLVAEPYEWILNQAVTVPSLALNGSGTLQSDLENMARGQVGLNYDVDHATEEYQHYASLYRARPKSNLTSSIDPQGDIATWSVYSYDATWQMIRGWHRMIYGLKKDPTLQVNRQLFYDTVRKTTFTGVTGPVQLNDVGDPTLTPLAMVNFHRKSGKWETTARLVNGQLVPLPGQSLEYVGSDPTFKPIDTPLRDLTVVSSVTKTALIVMSCIIIGFIAILQFYIIQFREHRIMKSASPLFLVLFLVGVQLLCSSVIPRALEGDHGYSPSQCNAELFLSNLGYTILIGALLVKTARLQHIFNRRQLKSTLVLSDVQLLLGLLILVVIELVPLLCLSLIKPMSVQLIEKSTLNDYYTCRTSNTSVNELNTIYLPVIMTFRFALLGLTTLCVWKVKDIPSDFNESTQLATTMYNLLFLSVLLPAIDGTMGRGLETSLIAYSSCIFIICVASAGILFVPKIYNINVPAVSRINTPNAGTKVDATSDRASSTTTTKTVPNPASRQTLTLIITSPRNFCAPSLQRGSLSNNSNAAAGTLDPPGNVEFTPLSPAPISTATTTVTPSPSDSAAAVNQSDGSDYAVYLSQKELFQAYLRAKQQPTPATSATEVTESSS